MRYFIVVYDEDDYPYITFENYKEAAKYFNTSAESIRCNVCRHQKKKYKNKLYSLYKIKLNKSDVPMPKCKNLHIGALLETLNI